MSTLPTKITIKAGDTLTELANSWFNDYSYWREIADLSGIDIFSPLDIGSVLEKPSKETAQSKYEALLADGVSEVESIVTQITNSREIKTIARLAGVNENTILEQLDLTKLSQTLTNQLTISGVSETEIYQLIDWVL